MNNATTKKIILFVCTGNTCRSPMAEALFNQLNPEGCHEAHSAGLAALAGQPASPQAIEVMRQAYGLDLTGHLARQAGDDLLNEASLIVTMTADQKRHLLHLAPHVSGKLMTLAEAAGQTNGDVQDPYGGDAACYLDTAAEIAALIRLFSLWLAQNFDCRQMTDS